MNKPWNEMTDEEKREDLMTTWNEWHARPECPDCAKIYDRYEAKGMLYHPGDLCPAHLAEREARNAEKVREMNDEISDAEYHDEIFG